jgi:AraC family transcriptional regulator
MAPTARKRNKPRAAPRFGVCSTRMRPCRRAVALLEATLDYPFDIRDCAPLRLAALAHSGPYPEIASSFERLGGVLAAHGLWPKTRGLVGVYYDSPGAVPDSALRSHAGAVLPDDVPVPDGLDELHLPGGRHAVLTLRGPYSGLAAAWQHLYATAMPEAGVSPADAPAFEVYLNDPYDAQPEDFLTEIRVPLAG